MALFDSAQSRLNMGGVSPYYPSLDERLLALSNGGALPTGGAAQMPALATPPVASPQRLAGMFGAPLTPRSSSMALGDDVPNAVGRSPSWANGMNGAGEYDAGPMTAGSLLAPDAIYSTPQMRAAQSDPLADLKGPSASDLKIKHPGFFQHGGVGEKILNGLSEFALRYSAGQGNPYAMGVFQQRWAAEQAKRQADARAAERQQDRAWEVEDRDFKANLPDYFSAGHDRVRYDPRTQTSSVIYDAPEDYQTYASQFGQAGSPEYNTAAQDYVLRGNGPTAYGYDADLEGVRQGNRVGLEKLRQQNRLGLRQAPTYRDAHPRPSAGGGTGGSRPPRTTGNVYAPILAKVAAGIPLSPGEQQVLDMRNRHSPTGGGSKGSGSGPTATDPKTGKKVRWNGSAWVPAS